MKNVLVTGGAGPFAKKIVQRLIDDKWHVLLSDADFDAVEAICNDFGAEHASPMRLDASRLDDVKSVITKAVAERGAIVGLVNAYGNRDGADVGAFTELDPGYWRRVVDNNLRSVLNCCYAMIPHMIEVGGGSIVSLSAFEGLRGSPSGAVFSAASAGTIVFTQVLSRECLPHKIRVNSLLPPAPEIAGARLNEDLALPVAEAVAHLLSDRAAATTGACLDVTGGIALH